MKIATLRNYEDPMRRVRVTLADGGSKDGHLKLVKRCEDGKNVTRVSVQGDRGRPLTAYPTNVESVRFLGGRRSR